MLLAFCRLIFARFIFAIIAAATRVAYLHAAMFIIDTCCHGVVIDTAHTLLTPLVFSSPCDADAAHAYFRRAVFHDAIVVYGVDDFLLRLPY